MRFTFVGFDNALSSGHARFHYDLEREGTIHRFTETLSFDPSIIRELPPKTLTDALLHNLLLILGISYWKTYCPTEIYIKPFSLTQSQAAFWNTVYTKGLGEFFYKNKIDYRGLVSFPFDSSISPPIPTRLQTADASLVMLGGGKDSIVSAELLRKEGKPFSLVALSPSGIHQDVARAIGVPLLRVERSIDAALFELNKQPHVYNGHIPISAIYGWVDVLLAALTNNRYVVASNEESANYGNVEYLGQEINHQWSKSLEYEQLFQQYLTDYVTPDITYYSRLRPMKEIEIVKVFTQYPTYFPIFTSCNTNFRMLEAQSKRWCGTCPKCAFIFLLLSAYLPKHTVVEIFGKNLFEDMSLLPLFEELLGVRGFKPFECVGTPEESIEAFRLAAAKDEYKDDPVVVALQKQL